jgi:hypothetical protein
MTFSGKSLVGSGAQNHFLTLFSGLLRLPGNEDVSIEIAKPDIAKNIPDNLYDFVEQLRQDGLKVDNYPFTWEGHEYLIEPYKAVRFDGLENEDGFEMVLMCGAQVGKTVFGFLLLIYLSLYFWGRYFGYFLPDKDMAMNFSQERYKPIARGIPEIRKLWGMDPTAEKDEKTTDQKSIRSIGPSKVIFSYMKGITSTESWPLLALIFDEVRRMMDSDIERATERISHSPYPINIKFSTAGYPDTNIDKAFKRSYQSKFHSACKCKDGVILSDCFPECVVEKVSGSTAHKDLPDYFYMCPTCKEVIHNPRVGKWIKHNPKSKIKGFHIPQTLSKPMTAERMLTAMREASDLQEFFNSKLGIAYLSPESQIVNEEILRATVNTDIKFKTSGVNCAMGIDQMGGFNVVVIREWGPKAENGIMKSRLVHLEWIEALDPWERCSELMKQYDVSVCVPDAGPNYNDAMKFAGRHRGKVFLGDYTYDAKGGKDICIWGDRPTDPNKKASIDTKSKYRVRISRFHAIEWNLMRYVNRMKEQPDERGLVAEVTNLRGVKELVQICKLLWTHLQKIARRKEWIDESQDKYKMIFENIGLDPHFLHADLYCEIALSRIRGEGKAFDDFKTAFKPPEKGEHDWQGMEHHGHYECAKCKRKVLAAKGNPQEIAEGAGIGECFPDASL